MKEKIGQEVFLSPAFFFQVVTKHVILLVLFRGGLDDGAAGARESLTRVD